MDFIISLELYIFAGLLKKSLDLGGGFKDIVDILKCPVDLYF